MKYLNLIFMSSTWDLNHRKGLHTNLQERLSSWSNVIFIESPFSLLYHTFFRFRTRVIPVFKKKNISGDVKSFAPVTVFHHRVWKKIPLSLKLDSLMISSQLRRFIKKYFPESKIIAWANSPFDYANIKNIDPKNIIYDYYDNFSYDNSGRLNRFLDDLNRRLIKNSDLIFCTGKVMYDFAKSMNKNTWYVPNGHNLILGRKITKKDLNVNGKIIGYIGNIRDWIDFTLIGKLLNSLKKNDYLFFIGPIEKNVLERVNLLKKNDSFRHLPAVEYSEIFNFIKAFDIGIIPFKINKFTEGVLPNKFFEYIAADIKIVSTPLPDLLQFKNIINVAKDCDEFIEMCINENMKLNKDQSGYKKIKDESTWNNRAGFIESKVKELQIDN